MGGWLAIVFDRLSIENLLRHRQIAQWRTYRLPSLIRGRTSALIWPSPLTPLEAGREGMEPALLRRQRDWSVHTDLRQRDWSVHTDLTSFSIFITISFMVITTTIYIYCNDFILSMRIVNEKINLARVKVNGQ